MKLIIIFTLIFSCGKLSANGHVDSLVQNEKISLASLMTIIPDQRLPNYELVNQFKNDHISFKNGYKDLDPLSTKINYNILAGFGAAYLASGIGLHIYQSNAWWKKDSLYTGKFAFISDWNYALWIDKFGHCYATHLLAHAISGGIEAADVQSEQSTWYSASLALLYELYIETEDGFAAPRWGFSPGDASADFLGASFYVAQYYYPFLKNFQLKWSYWPSKKFKENSNKIIIDDYEGQKYWISTKVKNMLPEQAAKYWPSFLNVAAGMGVKNLNGSGGGQREFFVSLDLDAAELPFHGKFGEFVKNSLNYFHLPMPGMRITPHAAFFILCY